MPNSFRLVAAQVRKTKHVIQVGDFGSQHIRWIEGSTQPCGQSLNQSCLCDKVNTLNTKLRWAFMVRNTVHLVTQLSQEKVWLNGERVARSAEWAPLPGSAFFVCCLDWFYSTSLCLQYALIIWIINFLLVPWALLVSYQNWWWFWDFALTQHLQMVSEVKAVLRELFPQVFQHG